MLVDLVIGVVERKAPIETSKIRWGVVFGRENGRFINAFRTGYANIITGWTDTGSPIFNPAQIPTLDDVEHSWTLNGVVRRAKYVSGGTRPSASWGRCSLSVTSHASESCCTSCVDTNR